MLIDDTSDDSVIWCNHNSKRIFRESGCCFQIQHLHRFTDVRHGESTVSTRRIVPLPERHTSKYLYRSERCDINIVNERRKGWN
jgi:hypothetical protein